MLYTKTYKGKFRTKNPLKYQGDVGNIVYRSLWELRFMKWCDQNTAVQEWGSETVIVPYVSPLDKKVHRYFVDFYIKIKDKNGKIQKYLIEIIT